MYYITHTLLLLSYCVLSLLLIGCMYMYILFSIVQGVQEKLFFLQFTAIPSLLAYIAVRDLQSSQRNASVQSLLLTGNFVYNQ